ncbi:MAG: leucyl aminopeptidase [Desulfurivibrio sp.]|nr:leucyl aminopeptidase [Desulfurivibrio sp.]
MITIKTTTTAKLGGDTLLCFVHGAQDHQPATADLPPAVAEVLRLAWQSGDFTAKKQQLLVSYPGGRVSGGSHETCQISEDGKDGTSDNRAGPEAVPGGRMPGRLLLVGLGTEELSEEDWRLVGGTASKRLLESRAVKVDLLLPAAIRDEAVAALSEGLLLGSYRFNKYRGLKDDPEQPEPLLSEVVIHAPRRLKAVVQRAASLARGVAAARDMANEPGNGWTPAEFAEQARELGREYGLRVKVLSKAALTRLGMGGILAVSQGSVQPPNMVIVEHRVAAKAPTLLLVGKGLTFDSGGISLKPGSGMEEMKYDMCGGAAVLAAMEVVGREKPRRLNVVALVPASENMPGPAALKPGDIIRHYGGKTVEVINTDAEGRLLLADALAYGVAKYQPAAVVDLATLTGAVIVALGHHHAGLLGNDDELCQRLLAAGQRGGEPLWRLPLGKEYRKQLDSRVADLKNVGKRDAGAIVGAAFLQEFVGETPWAHLDIAGTAWNFTEKSYIPKGPSGFGVRTLVELIRSY